jgi:hypothetical protein
MTVEEALRQSGFTNEQIRAMDPRAITAFGGVLTTAEAERREAESARQQNVDFYENKIAPSLANWEEEKQRYDNEAARKDAELAFYRTQNEGARAAGFIPSDAPGFQSRDAQTGRYVAGVPGGTPGSPQYFDVNRVYEGAGNAVSILTDLQWEHQRLFNQPLPISPSELVRRADSVKMDPRTYAAREFNWDARRQQMQAEESKKHDDAIRKEASDARDRYWSERTGNNPDVRAGMDSKFSDLRQAQRAGRLPDPLAMDENQRRSATRAAIRSDIAAEVRE